MLNRVLCSRDRPKQLIGSSSSPTATSPTPGPIALVDADCLDENWSSPSWGSSFAHPRRETSALPPTAPAKGAGGVDPQPLKGGSATSTTQDATAGKRAHRGDQPGKAFAVRTPLLRSSDSRFGSVMPELLAGVHVSEHSDGRSRPNEAQRRARKPHSCQARPSNAAVSGIGPLGRDGRRGQLQSGGAT